MESFDFIFDNYLVYVAVNNGVIWSDFSEPTVLNHLIDITVFKYIEVVLPNIPPAFVDYPKD
jgi:hypothetical protein